MNIFITGGAGFIGNYLAESFLADGDSVTIVDNLSTGCLENLDRLQANPKLKIIIDDITTMENLEELVQEADVIYNLAAAVGVELVVHDPVKTLMTNVHGSSRILELSAKYSKRVIQASTSEVYGKSTSPMFSESDDLLIGSPTHSRWSYACSKLLDEFFLMAYHQNSNMPGTVVRFFNIVGPRQTGKYGMVLPRFVEAALNNQPIRVFGTGEQSRCFCHVSDCVRALYGLAQNSESYGEIYNIGSQRSITMMELAKLVISELNSSSEIEVIPYDQAYAKGFEDMLRRAPNTQKISNLLGWYPEFSLEQIIGDVAKQISEA